MQSEQVSGLLGAGLLAASGPVATEQLDERDGAGRVGPVAIGEAQPAVNWPPPLLTALTVDARASPQVRRCRLPAFEHGDRTARRASPPAIEQVCQDVIH